VAAFRTSRSGNLWRHLTLAGTALALTVFAHRDGGYKWCASRADVGPGAGPGPVFSTVAYGSEEEALGELWLALEDGWILRQLGR
jgi:hypothetical protein